MLLKENEKKSPRDFKKDSQVVRQTISDSTDRWLEGKMGNKPENEIKISLLFVPTICTSE